MLSANPSMSPDRVKYALMATAVPDASMDPMAVGSGVVNGYAAAFNAPAGLANQGLRMSTGIGSLQNSRGTVQLAAASGANTTTILTSNLTGQLLPFSNLLYTGTVPWTGSNWSGSNWSGSNWSGSNWSGSNWSGSNWSGSNWSGSNWSGSNWSGSNWSGSNWSGSNWSGSAWYGSNWSGSAWYGAWDQ
jgi:serine protease AprX